MASVERIKQDIAALHQVTSDLAGELHQVYAEYLSALGLALRQQLVLSGYHVCTQGYPTQFLRLSLEQRQALQRSLRELATQTQAKLTALLSKPGEAAAPPDDLNILLTSSEAALVATDSPAPALPLSPVELSNWQEELETAIAQEFRVVSFKANRLLQQAGILPNKLPEFLKATSEVAAEAEAASSSNMLDVLMDSRMSGRSDDDDDDAEQATSIAMIVQLVAVHLQLTDVEFADGTTTVLRNRLRSLAARLKTLKQTFLKKERELAIASAEDAWRASWYED